MALDKVIQAILDDGKKEAEKIKTEGRTEEAMRNMGMGSNGRLWI